MNVRVNRVWRLMLCALPLLASCSAHVEKNSAISCQLGIRHFYTMCWLYAGEDSKHRFPPLALSPNLWCQEALYRKHLTDGFLGFATCPSSTRCTGTEVRTACERHDYKTLAGKCNDFIYLGYIVENEAQLRTLSRIYKSCRSLSRSMDEDLQVAQGEGNGGGSTIFRLHDAESDTYMDVGTATRALPRAQIPLAIERMGNHNRGGNVLYLDGHVEFVERGSRFPMTDAALKVLSDMER